MNQRIPIAHVKKKNENEEQKWREEEVRKRKEEEKEEAEERVLSLKMRFIGSHRYNWVVSSTNLR